MVTKSELYNILKQIVWFSSFSSCHRLNTFAEIEEVDDLNSPTFGKTYDDFVSGSFWARDWYYNGAPITNMKVEWNALTVHNELFSAVGDSASRRERFVINLIAAVGCPSCPDDCPSSNSVAYRWLFDSANYVLKQLWSYYRIRMSLVAGGFVDIWGNVNYGEWLVSNDPSKYSGYSVLEPLAPSIFTKDPVAVTKNGFQEIGISGLLGVFFPLEVSVCEEVSFVEEYTSPVAFAKGVTAQKF